MSDAKKRLLTGLQPSGQLHIGNYFGALKPFADEYAQYDSFLMIADYHSLTSLKDPIALRQNIIEVVRAYVAAGVDPSKAVIFKQSDVPEHTELAWIFETLVTVPFLMQAHAFKAKVAQVHEKWAKDRGVDMLSDKYFEEAKKEDPRFDAQVERIYSGINTGLLNYPMLMAADILLYDADVVPVGADQRQHIEYAREAAAKFNNTYSPTFPHSNIEQYVETFKSPKELILEAVGVIPGVDGQKMSKSYKNTIPLFGSKEDIEKAVMSIVTDSSGERPANVYAIHKLFKSEAELAPVYEANKGSYKTLKEILAADIEAFIAPMRAKYEATTEADVKAILEDGAKKARAVASVKMADVRKKVGVTI